ARSDIFSFGSLLYEMVTGERAFRGDSNVSTLAAIINKEPPPLSAEAPRDLQRIIARCLRKDPARRFQHMDDLKVALEELKEESDSGKLVGGVGLRPTPRQRRWLLPAAGLLVAVSLAATLWLWLNRTSAPPAEAPLPPVPLTSYPGSEYFPSFSPDGSQVAFTWNRENQDNWDIYVKVIGTEKPLRLTSDPAPELCPGWSPDGRSIAFLRQLAKGKSGYFLIPPIGGPERKLGEVALSYSAMFPGPYHCWSPDGKWLVIVDRDSPKEPHGLFALSVDTGERRRLTSPEPLLTGDVNPAISPDGRTLAYSRIAGDGASDLYLVALSADLRPQGQPRRLTSGPGMHLSPAWTADGKEIIHSFGPGATGALWRLATSGAGQPQLLAFAGQDAGSPAISRKGDRLVFVRALRDVNIWRIELTGTGAEAGAPAKFISSTREDRVPQYSPDGKKIAFQSDRSGSPEIWVCQSDGSSPVRLTSIRGPVTGQPRWSPDGRRIAFFSAARGSRDIYVIDAEGGPPRQLTKDPADEATPSWSQDGQWVYFHARRTAEGQIWKVPAAGGEAVQVTRSGGYQGRESADGRALFFKKGDSLWRVPLVKGMPAGPETQVLDSVDKSNYQPVETGIYFIATPDAGGAYAIRFYDFATRGIRTIATIRRPVDWGFTVSPDRRTILYAQQDEAGADLMLVENFR
ncbi:MAG: DPP IV N-terminal domain-containing protein, partial [Acidobacteriota bacterium]